MQFTIKARIQDLSSYRILDLMGSQISPARRSLFARLGIKREKINDLKKAFIRDHGLTARQFNSIHSEVKTLLSSQRELTDELVKKTERKKRHYQKKLKSLEDAVVKSKKKKNYSRAEIKTNRFKVHQFKRKIAILDHKIKIYSAKKLRPRVCFGSKALFKKQGNLSGNRYLTHEEWRADWQKRRDSSFFLIGSKDESFGNQSCQLLPGRLKLRLTNALAEKEGRTFVEIPVEFTYQQEIIQKALLLNQAINYRFIREENGSWYVHLTTKLEAAKIVTDRRYGALGIDLNPSCIAVTHSDPYGNFLKSWQVHLQLRGRRSEQVRATLSEAISEIVYYAKQQKIPIVIEDLDFEGKKQELRSRGLNRMLSSFAYSLFHKLIFCRSFKKGVELKIVNPAYTSVIGKVKFASGYGLSSHMAAAFTIARRGQYFGEQIRAKTNKHLTLPARTRGKHEWSDWRRLSQKAKGSKPKKNAPLRRHQPDWTQGDVMSSHLTSKDSSRTLYKGFGSEATSFH